MDDLTRSILEHNADREAHPGLYNLEMVCRDCGKQWAEVFPKEDIADYKAGGGKWPLPTHCERCATKDND